MGDALLDFFYHAQLHDFVLKIWQKTLNIKLVTLCSNSKIFLYLLLIFFFLGDGRYLWNRDCAVQVRFFLFFLFLLYFKYRKKKNTLKFI